MTDKEKKFSEFGVGHIRERGIMRFEKPGLILSCKSDSFEMCPVLKEESSDKYCHGQVLGYKAAAAGKSREWCKVSSTGTDTEKRACGVLIAADTLPGYAYTSSHAFKKEPIPPWAVLVKDAVIVGALLREKGSDGPKDDDAAFSWYEKPSDYTDYDKRVMELENYCNIKVSEPLIALSDMLAKPGAIT